MASSMIALVELVAILVIWGITFGLASSFDPAQYVPDRPMTCPNCEASFESPDSVVCWNCGADLVAYSRAGELDRTRPETYREVETYHWEESERSVSIGKCMVCKFDVRDNEESIWCPRCGTMAHKDHFLEWLHVKHTCPVCREHLNEELLRQGN